MFPVRHRTSLTGTHRTPNDSTQACEKEKIPNHKFLRRYFLSQPCKTTWGTDWRSGWSKSKHPSARILGKSLWNGVFLGMWWISPPQSGVLLTDPDTRDWTAPGKICPSPRQASWFSQTWLHTMTCRGVCDTLGRGTEQGNGDAQFSDAHAYTLHLSERVYGYKMLEGVQPQSGPSPDLNTQGNIGNVSFPLGKPSHPVAILSPIVLPHVL